MAGITIYETTEELWIGETETLDAKLAIDFEVVDGWAVLERIRILRIILWLNHKNPVEISRLHDSWATTYQIVVEPAHSWVLCRLDQLQERALEESRDYGDDGE